MDDHPQLFSTGPGPKPKILKTKTARREAQARYLWEWRERHPGYWLGERNRQRNTAATRRYRARHPEVWQAAQARWRGNPIRKQRNRELNFIRKYGLRLADWEAEYLWQGGRCASFGCTRTADRTHHDHESRKYVCLLCDPHNVAEGLIGPQALDLRGW
jgi:hypothetical protein